MTVEELKNKINNHINKVKLQVKDSIDLSDISDLYSNIDTLKYFKEELNTLKTLEELFKYFEQNNDFDNLEQISIKLIETKDRILEENIFLKY